MRKNEKKEIMVRTAAPNITHEPYNKGRSPNSHAPSLFTVHYSLISCRGDNGHSTDGDSAASYRRRRNGAQHLPKQNRKMGGGVQTMPIKTSTPPPIFPLYTKRSAPFRWFLLAKTTGISNKTHEPYNKGRSLTTTPFTDYYSLTTNH